MAAGDTIRTLRIRTSTGLTTPYGDEVRLTEERYDDGRVAIRATGVGTGHQGWLSADEPDMPLAPGEFLVDRWNEPIALADTAEAAGLFEDTGRTVRVRLVNYPVWRLRR